jgi:hypothetical protein
VPYLLLRRVLGLVRSDERAATEAAKLEIVILRHQLTVLRRQVKRPIYRASDRGITRRGQQVASARDLALVHGPPGDAAEMAPSVRRQEVD